MPGSVDVRVCGLNYATVYSRCVLRIHGNVDNVEVVSDILKCHIYNR